MDKKENIELSELIGYLDGISKEHLEALINNEELSGAIFHHHQKLSQTEELSRRAMDLYLKNIGFYIEKKFGFVSGGPTNNSFKNQMYDKNTISIPSGLIKWFNDFIEIQQINNDLRKETTSSNKTILLIGFLLPLGIFFESFSSFRDGSITLFDLLGQASFSFLVTVIIFKIIFFLGEKKKEKQCLSNINNEVSNNRLELNPKIELLIKRKLQEELLEQENKTK